ncbi:arf-GAP with dual PH domain-containing protein 1-like [Haliotis cracherodii]|uniref:arf-GAP with dual PH domain-containing protein 1-like n=1 Tax=Haliotis cracherodii TaxID=6455 RepID=UPI0039EC063A
MADKYRQALGQIIREPGNGVCADCGTEHPSWASSTIGIFLCQDCAGMHRALNSISRVKSVTLDNWDSDQVELMQGIGNSRAKERFEMNVPPFYRRPQKESVEVLKKEWIFAKYQRLEFTDADKQDAYNCAKKEGLLLKLGRDRKLFQQRKFVLSRPENKLQYFVIEDSSKKPRPKAEIDLDEVNAVFVPEKIGHPYGMQITFYKDGSTRSLFVHSESSKDIVDWYHAIRAAKLERRRIAFPDRDLDTLAEDLTRDFMLEGWLYKMGPRNEPFKRRWFTLDKRKLMYYEDPLNAFPKGEIFIGHRDAGYHVTTGTTEDKPTGGSPFCFTLHTPDRKFVLKAESKEEMDKWVDMLNKVIDMPLTPQDSKLAAILVPKKSNSIRLIKR